METGGARMSVRTWRRVRPLLLLDLGYTVTATAEALLEQINPPGSYHDIEAICRELPGQLFPDPEDAPVTRAHGPNLSLSNSCFIMILLQ